MLYLALTAKQMENKQPDLSPTQIQPLWLEPKASETPISSLGRLNLMPRDVDHVDSIKLLGLVRKRCYESYHGSEQDIPM